MSRFISDKLIQIDLGNGDFIKVKEALSYEKYAEIYKDFNSESQESILQTIPALLKAVLIEWSFTDENFVIVPCTAENIAKLETRTVLEIYPLIVSLYQPKKKDSNQSDAQ